MESVQTDAVTDLNIAGLNINQKPTFVYECLSNLASNNNCSTKSIRVELAHAKNKKDTIFQNMKKSKKRLTIIVKKFYELEYAYEATKENILRLENLLGNNDKFDLK